MTLDSRSALERFEHWMKEAWRGTACGLYVGGPKHLLPTCFAVLAAECSGRLDRMPADQKQGLVEYIQQHQVPDSGLFGDGEFRSSELSNHPATYLYLQHTYFSLNALDALGEQPRYSIKWVEQFKVLDYMRGWFDGGPWSNPWLHSNHFMFVLAFLQHLHQRDRDDKALEAYDSILDYLDDRQDPETGLWQPDGGRNDRNAVYAAYHFYPFYFWRSRSPRHIELIIDTALGIQRQDGFYYPGGGACEDLDAAHALIMMTLLSDHRCEEVKASLMRCARAILDSQNEDGGFANYSWRSEGRKAKLVRSTNVDRLLLGRELVKRSWRYSGWAPLTCPMEKRR